MAAKKSPFRFVLKLVAGAFLLFLLMLVAIPLLFQGKIREKTMEVIHRNLNADVSLKGVSLSLLSHFPNATISLKGLQILNRAPFEGDTLLRLGSLSVTINLWDLFTHLDKPSIKYIDLEDGVLYLKVLKDGTPNWDIMKPDSTPQDTTPSTPFTLNLQGYHLKRVNLHYIDRSMPMELHLLNIDHKGKGNLSASTFHLETQNDIQQITLSYDGTTYLNRIRLQGTANLYVDLDRNHYEFLENELIINDLPLSLQGSITLYEGYYDLDLKTRIEKAPFAQLISLIPAVYWKDYEKIQFKGDFALDAAVKGIYSDSLYPNFDVRFQIHDGYMKYPDLPSPLENVQVDLQIQNSDPHLKNMIVRIQTCEFTLDQMPTSIQMEMRGIENPFLKGNVKTDLRLESILRVFPLKDYVIRGRLFADITIDGQYTDNTFPKLKGSVALQNGYLKSAQYPNELENVAFQLTALNSTGKREDFSLEISTFEFLLDKAPVRGAFRLKDARQYAFEGTVDANLDLEALARVLGFQDRILRGQFNFHLTAAGDLNSIQQGRYNQLKTDGQLVATNFEYQEKEQPALFIKEANCRFSPQQVSLALQKAQYGASDLSLTGFVRNYWGYYLANQTLEGAFQLTSQVLDLNQWLAEASQGETQPDSASPLEAPSIPENLKLEFRTSAGKILFKTYAIENFLGLLAIENKQVILKECRFNLLDASYQIAGAYNSELPERPLFSASASVTNFDLQKGFQAFPILQKYVPVARYAEGSVDMTLEMATPLNAHLEPIYDQLILKVVSLVSRGEIKGLPLTQALQKHLNTIPLDPIQLAQQKIQFEIQNGKLTLQPFAFTHQNLRIQVGGSNYINGNIDYLLEIEMPAQEMGNSLQPVVQKFGVSTPTPEKVILGFQALGPFANPVIKPASFRLSGEKTSPITGTSMKDQIQETKQKVQEQIQETKTQLKEQVEEKKEQVQQQVEKQVEQKKEETQQKVQEKKEEVQQQLEEKKKEVEQKVKGFGLPKFP